MTIWLKKLIIPLYIISFIFLAISTYNLTSKIPELDGAISDKDTQIRYSEEAFLRYEIAKTQTFSSSNDLYLIHEMMHDLNVTKPAPMITPLNTSTSAFIEINDNLLRFEREALEDLYAGSKGTGPDKNLVDRWYNTTDINELIKEEGQYNTDYLYSQKQSRNDLLKDKQGLISSSTILQILGLLAGQLAVIIGLTRKDYKTKNPKQS